MNPQVREIMKKAVKRSYHDKCFEWNRLNQQQKVDSFRLYLGIIIIELEMSEFISDLDMETLLEVKKMVIDEKTDFDKLYEEVENLTDEFIIGSIKKKLDLK